MKEKVVNNLFNFILKNKNLNDTETKKIKYGLDGLYSLITKLIAVFILCIFTNTLYEYILLLFFYALIRTYSFGLHASSSLICWIYTITIYVGGSLIIKYIHVNEITLLIIWLLSFISFVMWAPADTPKRPLIRANQRKKQKIKTCAIAIMYLIFLIFIKVTIIQNSIALSLLVQAIMINPLTYKITNTTFNNYKNYPIKV